MGVDNLNVVGYVGRLLDGVPPLRPLELGNDGDLICLIRKMLYARGEGTVCIFQGYGSCGGALVRKWPELDRDGNDRADEAADFGRPNVWPEINDARRNLSVGVGTLSSKTFFIAISRAVVNSDGRPGLAPDPLVWSAGRLPKRRKVVRAVRDAALLPGPAPYWESGVGECSMYLYH